MRLPLVLDVSNEDRRQIRRALRAMGHCDKPAGLATRDEIVELLTYGLGLGLDTLLEGYIDQGVRLVVRRAGEEITQ